MPDNAEFITEKEDNMSYIEVKMPQIGDWVKTTIVHESLSGRFSKGSRVKIIGIDDMRGYTIEDAEGGHVMREIGWEI